LRIWRSSSLNPGPRLDAELIVERPTRPLVGLQRLRLPARSVKRQHQLPGQPFPQRVLPDEPLQLCDRTGVPPQRELGIDPCLDRGQAKLLEARDLVLGKRLKAELRQRWAAPEGEGLGQALEVAALQRALQPLAVELTLLDTQEIAGRLGDEPVPQLTAEQGDGVTDDLRRTRRRRLTP
jgi:hypothetical protein